MEMLSNLVHSFRVKDICFFDDDFATSATRVQEICEGILRRSLDIRWSCFASVRSVSRELLALMKKAGCTCISYGIESGDETVLRNMRKNQTCDRVLEVLAWTRAAGIRSRGFIMLGFPGETVDTLNRTLKFVPRLPLNDLQVDFAVPYPNTWFHDHWREFGSFDEDWSRMNGWYPLFVPHGLTSRQLEDFQKRMLRSFYMRPGVIKGYLARLAQCPSSIHGYVHAFAGFTKLQFSKPRRWATAGD